MEAYQVLEQRFGGWAGVSNVVACNSGTAALHLALEALRLPLGSEVILPDYTMVACARAVVLAGHVPVFVDCIPDTLLIDPYLTEKAVHHRTKVIMAVHNYGRHCSMDRLHSIADHYGLHVIEDLAEAHGIAPHSKSDAACWSFYKNKIIAGEEGGAIAFRDSKRSEYARCLRSIGFKPEHDYTHYPRGHNYRLANALAQLVVHNLNWIDRILEDRQKIVDLYNSVCPPEWKQPARQANWVYDIRIKGMSVDQQRAVVKALQVKGLAARFGFKPMSWQAEFVGRRVVSQSREAEKAASEVVYLPINHDGFDEELAKTFPAIIRSVL